MKLLDKAERLITQYELNEVKPQYHVRKASILRFLQKSEEAKYHAQEAISAAQAVSDKRNELDAYLMMGILTDNPYKSAVFFKRAIDLYGYFNDNISQASQYVSIYKKFFLNGISKPQYLDSAKVILDTIDVKNKEYYIMLSYYYENLFTALSENVSQDSIYNILRLQYDAKSQSLLNQRQEQATTNELKLSLKLNKDRLEEAEHDKKLLQLILAIGSLMLLLVTGLFYGLYKSRSKLKRQAKIIQKTNKELANLNRKNNMLLSEVHHRVKNNLQNILGLIYLKKAQDHDKSTNDFFEDISSKIHSMSLIHEQLYLEGSYEFVNFKKYIHALVDKFSTMLTDIKVVKFDIEIDENIKFNTETIMPLGIILSELIVNSIKHNQYKDSIKIQISATQDEQEQQYTLSYKDNGKGLFDIEKSLEDNSNTGLKLIRSLNRQLRGRSRFDGKDGFLFEMDFSPKTVSKI